MIKSSFSFKPIIEVYKKITYPFESHFSFVFVFQGNEMKKIIDLATNFSRKIKEIVEGIKAGVELFKGLITGKISFKKMADDLVMALTLIPRKVRQSFS